MAWEYPKHSCGHAGERVQMYGPGRDRERRLAAIERQDCPVCRARAADARCAELPPLEGTEKQVAWESDMRASVLSDKAATLAANRISDEMIPYALRVLNLWAKQTTARWWIDTRLSRNLVNSCEVLKRKDEIKALIP